VVFVAVVIPVSRYTCLRRRGFLASRGDARAELYANVERLRSEAETMSFVDLSRFRGAIGIERVVVILSIEVFARAGTLPQ
jgi:hypothetical protein